MLPFEALPVGVFEEEVAPPARPFRHTAQPPLPLYVEPATEESLFSWLHRLATRLGVSWHTLASQSFGVDDRSGHTPWWHRPHPWTLARIGQRTGVSLAQLRPMTFEEFQPAYRDDEAPARFAGRRYDTRAPDWRAYRFAICGPCFEGDPSPYLRNTWLIGWIAVCPEHNTGLISRCEACHAGLRVPPFANATPFWPVTCTRCRESLLTGYYPVAHPSVIHLQAALLKGKREGVTQLDGLGQFTWKEVVALADVLLGMVWTDTTYDERTKLWLRYEYESLDEPRIEMRVYGCRHDSLRLLSWLIEGWPRSLGATIGRDMLRRGLSGKRNRLSHHLYRDGRATHGVLDRTTSSPKSRLAFGHCSRSDMHGIPGIKAPFQKLGTIPAIKEQRQTHSGTSLCGLELE